MNPVLRPCGVLWGILALLALAGCASVKDTEVFYTPSSDKVYPPKPKDAPITVLAEPPAAGQYRPIGRWKIQSDAGYKFLYRAMLHNARINGADAVVIRGLDFQLRRTMNYIPARWDYVPVTTYGGTTTVKNKNGKTSNYPNYYTQMIPVFRPPETIIADVQWINVDAEMLVRRGTQAVEGFVPAVPVP